MPQWSSILASITRHYPFYSGAARLAETPILKTLSKNNSTPRWTRSPGGELKVSLDDLVGRCVYFFGDHDPKITWILKRLIRSGDSVVDGGAHIGIVTLWMARLVGPLGQVHAFEPNPLLYKALKDAVEINALQNVSAHITRAFRLVRDGLSNMTRVSPGIIRITKAHP